MLSSSRLRWASSTTDHKKEDNDIRKKKQERREKAEEENIDAVEKTFRVCGAKWHHLREPVRAGADLTLLLHNLPKMQNNLFKTQEPPKDLPPQNEHLI